LSGNVWRASYVPHLVQQTFHIVSASYLSSPRSTSISTSWGLKPRSNLFRCFSSRSSSDDYRKRPIPGSNLVVLAHGRLGNEWKWDNRESVRVPGVQLMIHSAVSNVGRTWDGVAVGGLQLAQEMQQKSPRLHRLQVFAFLCRRWGIPWAACMSWLDEPFVSLLDGGKSLSLIDSKRNEPRRCGREEKIRINVWISCL
jgi:hypothetical protein